MPRFSSADHPLIDLVAWRPELPAERANDYILYSRGTSNAHLIATADGDIIVNTGMSYQGARHRERFERLLGRPLNVKKIILTQSHPDHLGGWGDFTGPGVETIITGIFPEIQKERALLGPFFAPRGQRIVGNLMPNPEHLKAWKPEANVDEFLSATRFIDHHAFSLGGREVEMFAAPSGETIDALIVWLPQERIAFTGNFLGALYGALPHFYTPRGDRQRSVAQFLRDLERLIALKPELLITGHGAPIAGEAQIHADLTRLRDAVAWIHDKTVEGMNAGKDLYTLMEEVALPASLQTAPGRGPVRWYVRAIWEEYTGWFRHETTTELYSVPQRAIWGDIVKMVGGVSAFIDAARVCVSDAKPLHAIHFLDIVGAIEPGNSAAALIEVEALEVLIEQSRGESHDQLTWLESKWREARSRCPKPDEPRPSGA